MFIQGGPGSNNEEFTVRVEYITRRRWIRRERYIQFTIFVKGQKILTRTVKL